MFQGNFLIKENPFLLRFAELNDALQGRYVLITRAK